MPPSISASASFDDSEIGNTDVDNEYMNLRSSRPARKKRKMSLNGMQAWGSVEFQELETEKLQSAWISISIRWCTLERVLRDLKAQYCHIQPLITQFQASWLKFYAETEKSGAVDSLSMARLTKEWEKVEQEVKNSVANEEKKSEIFEFGRSLQQVEDRSVLYDCIKEFSNSVDRKDEDKDEDFKDRRSRSSSKKRRRNR